MSKEQKKEKIQPIKIFAEAKYLKISPKKVRLVLDVIRGMSVEAAQNQLRFFPKKASSYILQLINSAIANAEHNFNLKKENLYVKEIFANEGPALQRWMPKALGRATPIKKRSSHIVVILAEKTPTKSKIKKEKIEKPILVDSNVKKEVIVEELEKKEGKVKPKTEEHKPETPDVRMEGKHRHKEHLDQIRKKGTGGFLKKIFRRKSG